MALYLILSSVAWNRKASFLFSKREQKYRGKEARK